MSTLEELRAQLDHEVNELGKIEDALQYQNSRLGKLNIGYLSVMREIIQIHDRNLFPLAGYRRMLEDQIDFITTRMEWTVLKIQEVDKVPEISDFSLEIALEPCAAGALEDARRGLMEAYEKFDTECSTTALYVLMNTSAPSDIALETLRVVAHILGEEDDSWEATRVLLTSNYFIEFFRRRSNFLMKQRDALPPELMLQIDKFCRDIKHSQYALYDDNVCLGVLGEWIRAIWNYYRCVYITAPVLLQDKTLSNLQGIKGALEELTFGELSPMPILKPRLLTEHGENDKRRLAWGEPPLNPDADSPSIIEDSVVLEMGGSAVVDVESSGNCLGQWASGENDLPTQGSGGRGNPYPTGNDNSLPSQSNMEKESKEMREAPPDEARAEEEYEKEDGKREDKLELPKASLSPAPVSTIFHEMVRRLDDSDTAIGPSVNLLEELKTLMEWRDHLDLCLQEVVSEIEHEEELIATEIRLTQEGYDEDMIPRQDELEALVRDFVEQYVDTRNTGKKFYWYVNQEEAESKKHHQRHSMLNEMNSS